MESSRSKITLNNAIKSSNTATKREFTKRGAKSTRTLILRGLMCVSSEWDAHQNQAQKQERKNRNTQRKLRVG